MQFGEYQIVRYTPEYQENLLDLISLLWGADRDANAVYLNWKYDQNPYADQPWIYLALYQGHAVGVRGNLAMRWQAGEPAHYIECLCDADAVVLPDHRRKGLLQALSRYNLSDLAGTSYRYFVTLSANAKSSASVLKLGWQHLGLIHPANRLRPQPGFNESRLKNLVRKIPKVHGVYTRLRNVLRTQPPLAPQSLDTLSSYDMLDQHWRGQRDETSQVVIEDAPRPQQMAELVAGLPANRTMRHVRDAVYFAWRYRNPRSSYRYLFWGRRELAGYLVLQTPARPGVHPVTIVDWEARDLAVRTELLETAIQLGDFEILSTWGISLPSETIALLRNTGFVFQVGDQDDKEYKPEILLKPITLAPQQTDWQVGGLDLLDLQNWDFRPINSDSY